MKITINIPESLNDITLKQYQKWLKIADDKKLDNFLKQKMIEIFCNVELKNVLQMKATDVTEICNTINNLFKSNTKLITKFDHNEKEFGFVPKLDDMSFGEYIDLDTYMADWQNMHKAMSVLFRPIKYKKKEQYLIEDYESAENYDLKNMSLDIVFGALVFFLEFKERIAEAYSELFSESDPSQSATASAGFAAKWGWYQSIYGITNGDIMKFDEVTKLNLHKCLQHLAFEKDKYQLEKSMINAKR